MTSIGIARGALASDATACCAGPALPDAQPGAAAIRALYGYSYSLRV
jgi:hypothetical protein